eukprot:326160-Chlamydomonas_euryale.AAC.4
MHARPRSCGTPTQAWPHSCSTITPTTMKRSSCCTIAAGVSCARASSSNRSLRSTAGDSGLCAICACACMHRTRPSEIGMCGHAAVPLTAPARPTPLPPVRNSAPAVAAVALPSSPSGGLCGAQLRAAAAAGPHHALGTSCGTVLEMAAAVPASCIHGPRAQRPRRAGASIIAKPEAQLSMATVTAKPVARAWAEQKGYADADATR